jgi:hypothetical protein
VYDGSTANRSDGFDDGLMLVGPKAEAFDDQDGNGTVNGRSLTVGRETFLSGLRIYATETALSTSPTLRVVYRLQNSTANNISETLRMDSNLGSDQNSRIDRTSSGDQTFSAADRWLVTSEASDPLSSGNDPPVAQALYGKHARVPVSKVDESPGVPCKFGDFKDAVIVGYHVTVPAHTTRFLMFFAQMTDTSVADAVSLAKDSFQGRKLPHSLLKGVAPDVRRRILNWAL